MSSAFRDFLRLLEGEGQLLRIQENVNPRFELSQILKEVDRRGGPALLFERVSGCSFPVAGNLLGTRHRLALLFGTSEEHIVEEYERRRSRLIPPVVASYAPCQEVVVQEEMDILKTLPIPTYHEKDGGPYITCGVLFAKDPLTGQRGVGLHRLHVKGKNRLGVHLSNPPISQFQANAEALGNPLEVAIALGVDPVILMASIVRMPTGDKLALAGGLRGEAVEVVRGTRVGVEVPARAEAVLEGKILPGVREDEGPFGETSGYYFRDRSHVIEVTAITHRDRPISQALHPMTNEVVMLAGASAEAELLRFLRGEGYQVRHLHLTGGTSRPHALISLRKKHDGEPKQLLYLLLSHSPWIKHAAVLDDDVDLHDPDDVEWALSTRVQGDRDLVVLSGLPGRSIDPSTRDGFGSKVGVDATVPIQERERYVRPRVPADVAQKAREFVSRYLKEGEHPPHGHGHGHGH
ncbi:MAG: UbiD family decarboxylase [Candidatus Tectomicrobia bacterium]|uniref:UbiD family decarboxylase n=1 Tax=Tectimicrobiota bacterium TaxID=2528274 RepID=A0A932GPU1_UNCTE|nr:UbiD family decarboxylase [Candidatus Tectomicrobia bacterium]